jgi:hypothetical protein
MIADTPFAYWLIVGQEIGPDHRIAGKVGAP